MGAAGQIGLSTSEIQLKSFAAMAAVVLSISKLEILLYTFDPMDLNLFPASYISQPCLTSLFLSLC